MPEASEAEAVTTSDDEALARSVLFDAVALGFRPPTGDTLAQVVSEQGKRVLGMAAETVDSRETAELPAAVARLARLPQLSSQELAALHSRLFGHTARGLVCPYETEYGTEGLFRQPQLLADIAGYYTAFGLRPRALVAERVDHVCCECEFAGFLSRKQAYASSGAGGDAVAADVRLEMLETTRAAARSFIRNHLGRFGIAFGLRVSQEDSAGFYGGLADVLVSLLRRESERLEIPLGPATLDLRSTVSDDVPMVCGSGEELIQIQTRRRPAQS